MSEEKTGGQLAFETYVEIVTGVPGNWELEEPEDREAWEAAAAAGAAPAHERTADLLGEVNELRKERDRARDALGMLARIVHADVLVMEAAAIEMRQGDEHAATQWILNAMPDQRDGEPGTEWDGKETAQEWFDRQPAVQKEHPGPAVATVSPERLAKLLRDLAIPDEEG